MKKPVATPTPKPAVKKRQVSSSEESADEEEAPAKKAAPPVKAQVKIEQTIPICSLLSSQLYIQFHARAMRLVTCAVISFCLCRQESTAQVQCPCSVYLFASRLILKAIFFQFTSRHQKLQAYRLKRKTRAVQTTLLRTKTHPKNQLHKRHLQNKHPRRHRQKRHLKRSKTAALRSLRPRRKMRNLQPNRGPNLLRNRHQNLS